MKYGYARCSTNEDMQDVEILVLRLLLRELKKAIHILLDLNQKVTLITK